VILASGANPCVGPAQPCRRTIAAIVRIHNRPRHRVLLRTIEKIPSMSQTTLHPEKTLTRRLVVISKVARRSKGHKRLAPCRDHSRENKARDESKTIKSERSGFWHVVFHDHFRILGIGLKSLLKRDWLARFGVRGHIYL
jgi:hypothetical protein